MKIDMLKVIQDLRKVTKFQCYCTYHTKDINDQKSKTVKEIAPVILVLIHEIRDARTVNVIAEQKSFFWIRHIFI